MGQFFLTMLPPTDKVIFSLFQEIERLTSGKFNFNVLGVGVSISSEDNLFEKFNQSNTRNVHQINLTHSGGNIHFCRNHCANGFSSHQAHNFYCSLSINSSDDLAIVSGISLKISEKIHNFLLSNKLLISAEAPDGNDIASAQSKMLSAIQASASEQLIETQKFFNELTSRFKDRHEALEAEFAAQKLKLAAEADRERQQIQAEREIFKAEESALDLRRKQLDDRDNTHARRAIKTELLQTLRDRQTNFSVSKATRNLRGPIHAVFLILLLGTFSGSAWSLYIWGSSPSSNWTDAGAISGIVKSILLSFAFLTSSGLYISWMNRWFDKHAEAQFVTKQYEIDINRATWAVEAALEWQRAQGGEMPPALVNGITNHLFERERGESAEYSPLEALASSILGSAASMKLNMAGTEVNMDRKSIRAMTKLG